MAWLNDWANRLELTIDSDRVDEDLTYFPVLITLSSGSGLNNFDATDVFDKLVEISESSDGWNPSDAAGSITVTSGSLVAYKNSGTGWAAVRGVDSKTDGKWYWEVSCDVMAGTRNMIGIGTSSESLTYPGNTAEGYGYHSLDAGKYHAGFAAYGTTYTQGDIIGVALDLDSGKIWWSKNGVWQAGGDPSNDSTPAYTNVFGTFYVMVGLYDTNDKVSLNTGTSAFQYTIPTGFMAYNESYVDNTKKIAITDFTGINQLPVEIEIWDWDNEVAYLWTEVPTLTSGTDATLYLYYDTNQLDNDLWVGDPGDAAAINVWSNSYVAVYHMSQSPVGSNSIKDSKGFNDGTPAGSLNASDLIDAVPGKGINFNGSSDTADAGTHSSLNITNLSVEAMINPGSVTGSHAVFHKGNTAVAGHRGWWVQLEADEIMAQTWDGAWRAYESNNANLSTSTDYFIGLTLTTGASPCRMFKNDIELTGPAATSLGYIDDSDYAAYIGNLYQGTPSTWFDGTISELRISDTIRSVAWLKATYYSNFDNFMTLASGGTPPAPSPPEPDWWDSWANRLDITATSDWVDENLAYFPVLVTLSSGTGRNDFDNTYIFDDLTVNSGIDGYTSIMLPFYGDRSSSQHQIVANPDVRLTTLSGIPCAKLVSASSHLTHCFDSDDWDFGTGDFTLEMWVNMSSARLATTNRFFAHGRLETDGGSWTLGIGYNAVWGAGTRMNFALRSGGIVVDINSDAITSEMTADVWHHLAVDRSGGTLRFYVDGVFINSAACSYDLTLGAVGDGNMYMGRRITVGEYFGGYFGRVRISKDIARYAGSSFARPETYVNDSYTKFLWYCEGDVSDYGHDVIFQNDNSGILSGITSANYKFSTSGSFYFNPQTGPDSYLEIPHHSSLSFGSSDFTIEYYFYTIQHIGNHRYMLTKTNIANDYNNIVILHASDGNIYTYIANAAGSAWQMSFNSSAGYAPTGVWVHYALTREGNTARIYLNGFLVHTATITEAIYDDSGPVHLGGRGDGVLGYYGYIQGLKLSKGIAKYTGNFFSPPDLPGGDSWINRKKIQLADAEHNRLYTEIEYWDHANREAKLWTKVPVLTSGTDTTLYLYYDDTQIDNTVYVGDIGEPVAEQVWTGNDFTAVYHMSILNELTLSNFLDSTSNNNIGDFNNMDVFDFTDGQVSRALDFTRAGSEYISVPNDDAFDLTGDYTVEVVFRPTSGDLVNELINKTPNDAGGLQLRGDSGQGPNFWTGGGTVNGRLGWVAYGWQYAAAVLSGTTLPILYLDGYFHDSGSSTGTPSNSTSFLVGRRWDGHYFNGDIDEVRLSDVVRSPAWIKANYYNMWDDLLSYTQPQPFLTCSGIVTVNTSPTDDIPVRLYRRSTGELVGETTTISGGLFTIDSPYDGEHYILALYTLSGTNALIYDRIQP